MMKHRAWILIASTVLMVGIALAGIWISFIYTPLISESQGLRYNVRPGASLQSVINELESQHIIKHPLLFKLLARFKVGSRTLSIKTGEYLFAKGLTPPEMLDQMIMGSGMVFHSFTIIPGWNFRQLREALATDSDLQQTIPSLSDVEIMKRLGLPTQLPEGSFFPDTYYFIRNSSDLAILKRAYKMMQDKIALLWQKRVLNLPYNTPYEALTAASLVEKEAYLESERPVIAGVLVNRLRQGMLLQFDPTVIYGLGLRYDGKIHKTDLREDTPYNTYLHKGLPPTPIAMPSLNSLKAALNPTKHDLLYFVARGDGSHQFSKTLSEHNIAVSSALKLTPLPYFNVALVKFYLYAMLNQKKEEAYASVITHRYLHYH